jgi:hypothetical protein
MTSLIFPALAKPGCTWVVTTAGHGESVNVTDRVQKSGKLRFLVNWTYNRVIGKVAVYKRTQVLFHYSALIAETGSTPAARRAGT